MGSRKEEKKKMLDFFASPPSPHLLLDGETKKVTRKEIETKKQTFPTHNGEYVIYRYIFAVKFFCVFCSCLQIT